MSCVDMEKMKAKYVRLIKCIGSKGKVPFWALLCVNSSKMGIIKINFLLWMYIAKCLFCYTDNINQKPERGADRGVR